MDEHRYVADFIRDLTAKGVAAVTSDKTSPEAMRNVACRVEMSFNRQTQVHIYVRRNTLQGKAAVRIKCLFQGGGAKLVTLIVAAEALEELQATGELEVIEVAGTSAGSIAAYIFADVRSVETLRLRLKIAAAKVVDHFSRKLGKPEILARLAIGRPLYDERLLREFIRDILSDPLGQCPDLSAARIPVHVRTADMKRGRRHTYRAADGISADHALSDSCALPFALRTYKSTSPFVDGGILSNLSEPSIFHDKEAPVLAFSFERSEGDEFNDLASYLSSLAGTMIDNNVSESVDKVEISGGRTVLLPNHFGTLEFRKAMDDGLSDLYVKTNKELIKGRIRDALVEIKERRRKLDEDKRNRNLNSFSTSVLSALAKIAPYSVVSGSILCIADGLLAGQTKPDHMIKEVVIEASKESIIAFRIGISRTEAYELGDNINWEITDSTGRSLAAFHEVVESVQDGERVWHSCFCLKEPVPGELAPLKVKLATTHVGLMKALGNPGGAEWMRTISHQEDRIQQQDFVLAYPKAAGAFTMVDLLENVHRASQKPSQMERMAERWCVGHRMTSDELAPYRQTYLQLIEYGFIGWRVNEVPPGAFLGTLIEHA